MKLSVGDIVLVHSPQKVKENDIDDIFDIYIAGKITDIIPEDQKLNGLTGYIVNCPSKSGNIVKKFKTTEHNLVKIENKKAEIRPQKSNSTESDLDYGDEG